MEAQLEANEDSKCKDDKEEINKNQESSSNEDLDIVENPTSEEIEEFYEAPKCLTEKKTL